MKGDEKQRTANIVLKLAGLTVANSTFVIQFGLYANYWP
jgi:hypothetical protein